MNLSDDITNACGPLFEAIPMERAMARLRGSEPKQTTLVESILADPALANRPELAAGLWLYVDDLDQSHRVSQGIDGATGAFWHAIMHRREGDFSNSHYWLRRAAGHPLLRDRPEMDPGALVDAVASAGDVDSPELVDRQRQEWIALFEWCAARPA